MGNSCCYRSWLTAFRERCPKDKAKVLDSEGHLTFVELPMSVLDLMSDNPDFAVCAAEDIRQTHRLVRMNINQWLTPRKLYLLVPMHKVDSKVSDVQLAAVHLVCSGKKKLVPGDDYRDFLKGLFGNVNGQCQSRRHNYWSPALATIYEDCSI